MAKFNWNRVGIISATVLLAQQALKSTVMGFFPEVTGFGFFGVTVGGLALTGAAVVVGEMIAEKWA